MWKLIFGPGSGGWSKGRDNLPAQLYNLRDDLGERKNLYAQRPEKVKELTGLMETLVSNGRSTPGESQRNDKPFNWKRFMKTDGP